MDRIPKLNDLNLQRTPFPRDVIVETCAVCNLRCIMCPYERLKRPKGKMSMPVFSKIVDEIAQESPDARLWVAIMGEPFLAGESLIAMLRYARSKKVLNTHVNTNATVLTPDLCDRLLDTGVKEVLISLDAASKPVYDTIRVGGDFERAVRNTEYLLERKKLLGLHAPAIVVQFIMLDRNEHEAAAFRNYWLERGAVVKIRLKFGWGTAVPTEDLDKASVPRDFPCPWLIRTVSIQWDGKFAQCDADYEGTYHAGSIETMTIKQVWQGELALRREKHWNLDFGHPLCAVCRDWSVGRAEFFYPEGHDGRINR
jgi:sulfatase maturation enzyme AslB (radical SAM superfamily)